MQNLENETPGVIPEAGAASASPRPPLNPGRSTDRKSPALAAMLSIFPGVGQLYNGELPKAVTFVAGFATCIYLASHTDGEVFFVMAMPFLYFYNLIDAYQSAQRINLMALSGALPQSQPEASPLWGWSLIGMGVLLMLNNLGLLRFAWIAKFWPLLLVAAGVALLRGSLWSRN